MYYVLEFMVRMQELVRSPAPQLHLEYTFYKLLAPAGKPPSYLVYLCLHDGVHLTLLVSSCCALGLYSIAGALGATHWPV